MDTTYINVDLSPGSAPGVLNVSQNDSGRPLGVKLFLNGAAFTLTGYGATVETLKPDGNLVTITGTVSGNTVTWSTTEQQTAVAGKCMTEVRITDGSADIGSANFILMVESSPEAEGVESESEIASITEQVEALVAASTAQTYDPTSTAPQSGIAVAQGIADSFPTAGASGAVASFADGAGNIPIKDMTVNIEPVQAGSGDPSPTNVREISGWTAEWVNRTGRNILNGFAGDANTSVGITYTWGSGTNDGNLYWNVAVSGTTTGANSTSSNKTIGATTLYSISVNPGETITVSLRDVVGTLPTVRLFLRTSGNANIAYIDSSIGVWTWTNTTDERKRISKIAFRIPQNVGAVSFSGKLQCEVGDSASDSFIPYEGECYNISFGDAVYGGTVNPLTGVLTVGKANIPSYNGESLPGKWISDRDVYAPAATPTIGAQVVYDLATPVTYQLTPVQIRTLLGYNNIWADSGDVNVTYRADPTLYVDGKIEPIKAMVAAEEDGDTASTSYTAGQYFLHGGQFCKALTNIASGATFTLGTNYQVTTIGAELYSAHQS